MADVDFGQMHLFGEFTNSGNAGGFGQNEDMLTFTAPGVAMGTFMDVTFGISVDGVIEGASGGGQGRWGLQADLGGGYYDISVAANNDVIHGYVGDPFGLYTATVTVQAGFAAPLDIELRAAGVSSSGGSAFGDLTHSLYWAGISNVSVGGVALDDFTVTSASGTDWSRSFVPTSGGTVPEPADWALMLTGFAGLGSILRRRRSAWERASTL